VERPGRDAAPQSVAMFAPNALNFDPAWGDVEPHTARGASPVVRISDIVWTLPQPRLSPLIEYEPLKATGASAYPELPPKHDDIMLEENLPLEKKLPALSHGFAPTRREDWLPVFVVSRKPAATHAPNARSGPTPLKQNPNLGGQRLGHIPKDLRRAAIHPATAFNEGRDKNNPCPREIAFPKSILSRNPKRSSSSEG